MICGIQSGFCYRLACPFLYELANRSIAGNSVESGVHFPPLNVICLDMAY